MKFYSEFGEDRWIAEHLPVPQSGFYVDLGCAWPQRYSNTAFLRDKGWRGLCVDGNSVYAEYWVGLEEFVHAVIGDGELALFQSGGVPELSRIGSGISVSTQRLSTLVEDVRSIDFLSCDLEGAEYDALKTLDWQKHQPKIIVSEYNTHGIGEDFRVRDMLLPMGYREVHRTVANIIFTR